MKDGLIRVWTRALAQQSGARLDLESPGLRYSHFFLTASKAFSVAKMVGIFTAATEHLANDLTTSFVCSLFEKMGMPDAGTLGGPTTTTIVRTTGRRFAYPVLEMTWSRVGLSFCRILACNDTQLGLNESFFAMNSVLGIRVGRLRLFMWV